MSEIGAPPPAPVRRNPARKGVGVFLPPLPRGDWKVPPPIRPTPAPTGAQRRQPQRRGGQECPPSRSACVCFSRNVEKWIGASVGPFRRSRIDANTPPDPRTVPPGARRDLRAGTSQRDPDPDRRPRLRRPGQPGQSLHRNASPRPVLRRKRSPHGFPCRPRLHAGPGRHC